VLFTYLTWRPCPHSPTGCSRPKLPGIAYETIRDRAGTLPLLTPCPKVAGRMSVQVGATYLEKEKGGRGVLLGGVPGVPPATVCILGGGIVGTNAAKIALGMGANVTIVDLNLNRLRELDDIFNGRVYTLASNSYNVARAVQGADLVIGGVLIPGAAAAQDRDPPNGLTHEERRRGGRCRDRPGRLHRNRTSHHPQRSFFPGRRSGPLRHPTCPRRFPIQSTLALTNATFAYVLRLAQHGAAAAIKADPGMAEGVNTYGGTPLPTREWRNP